MTATVGIEGMNCGHCEQTVAEALRSVSGMSGVTIDREGGQAKVDGDADVTALIRAVEDAGYTAHA